MKIVVLNGSPKGRMSVTMQYVEYLARRFPNVTFDVYDVAHTVTVLERDEDRFHEVVEAVRRSDAVLWAFPLYILLVSSQYKRFIELIEERGATEAFAGRYAATLSTSINYFDHTAHAYMRSVCEDMGMPYAGFYSANMHDLMKASERQRLDAFAEDLFETIRGRAAMPRSTSVLVTKSRELHLERPAESVDATGLRVVVVTDERPGQGNLRTMTEHLMSAIWPQPQLINLYELDIRGGCHGCLRCGAAYRCAYTGRDGFIDFYNQSLRSADVIVFAGSIVARQLSWKWRQFFDRSFFNTHTPSLAGKQIAFLLSGPATQLPEMREVYEAWVELQRANLVAFLSDEYGNVGSQIDALAERLVRLARAGYIRPRTFLGIGGMKIFRDDIFAGLRIIFRADHRAYKRMGLYDFPQRRPFKRALVAVGWFFTGLPGIRKRFPLMIRRQMVRPYASVLDRVIPKPTVDAAEPSRALQPTGGR